VTDIDGATGADAQATGPEAGGDAAGPPVGDEPVGQQAVRSDAAAAAADADGDGGAGAPGAGGDAGDREPAAPAGDGAGTGEADHPLPDTVAVERQRDEYLGALQRLQADFENYRKRVQRQQEEMAARAAMSLVRELLPTLDALDLARAHLAVVQGPDGEPDLSPDAQALVQARALLLGSLEKGGLERLDAPGVPFDPEVHDAVAHAPDEDGAEGEDDPQPARGPVVDEVLRAGYRWQGQTLRPAMVRVRG